MVNKCWTHLHYLFCLQLRKFYSIQRSLWRKHKNIPPLSVNVEAFPALSFGSALCWVSLNSQSTALCRWSGLSSSSPGWVSKISSRSFLSRECERWNVAQPDAKSIVLGIGAKNICTPEGECWRFLRLSGVIGWCRERSRQGRQNCYLAARLL